MMGDDRRTGDAVLTRLVRVDDLPAEGLEVVVTTSEEDRRALAAALDIPSVDALTATYLVRPRSRGAAVTGSVKATVHQTCVVTLEPIEVQIEEPVDVRFSRDVPAYQPGESHEGTADQPDPPDPIVDGRIDLGTVTAEFLALGLDPYPKAPGIAFEDHIEDHGDESPFAALARLRSDKKE
jgi:uncharacterized metal-binding protein YceD (DUF177 family)